jgi:peptidoglycan hydrolase-like protein with peptidoglycan-binding domain
LTLGSRSPAVLLALLLALAPVFAAADDGPVTLLTAEDVGGVAPSEFRRIAEAFHDTSSDQVLVVAHRGDWQRAPENSLPAIDNCITMGVDVVEIDLKKTADGHLVLMHDRSVKRTTAGRGRVDKMTLEEVRALRLEMADGTPTEAVVPTLEEAMLRVKGRCMVNLDHAQGLIPEALEVLERTGTLDHAIFKGLGEAEFWARRLADVPEGMVYMPILDLRGVDLSAVTQRVPGLSLARYEEGMEHPEVAELQRALGRVPLFDDREGFSTVVDERTLVAIKVFQRRHGLVADGVAGPKSLRKMMELGWIGHGTLKAATPPSVLGLTASRYRKEDSGPEIEAIQRELAEQGLFDNGGVFTQFFGSVTEEAIRAFQARHGLEADGVAGSGTLARLEEESRLRQGLMAGTLTLKKFKKGVDDEEVATFQRALTIAPLFVPALGPSPTFDADTRDGVMAFQRRYGLTADGVAGEETVAKLIELGAATRAADAPPPPPDHAVAQPFLDQLGSPAFEIIFDDDRVPIMSATALAHIRASGARIWVNSLWNNLCGGHADHVAVRDPDAAWGWLIDRGVTVIQTDTPEALLTYLRERGLHW